MVCNNIQTNTYVNCERVVTIAKHTIPNGICSQDIRQQCEVNSIILSVHFTTLQVSNFVASNDSMADE
jgi:hypothetical protein